MGAVVAGGWQGLQALALGSRMTDLLAIGGLIPVGIGAYAVTLWTLRIEGRHELEVLLARLPIFGRIFRAAF
jgi:hypothetical protein